MTQPPLRVLVVDDSVFNRRSLTEILVSNSEVEVVGKAADGEEALRLVSLLKPDVITLDLEMPRMDGFTFLRILMTKMPTPVIVVSSYSQKENVFKALELGALDFVAKPDRYNDPDLTAIRDELVQKVRVARSVRLSPAVPARRVVEPLPLSAPVSPRTAVTLVPPRYVVAIASSTGGPSALMEIFSRLPDRAKFAVLIAQHMPDKFTRTFAERLDRRSALRVSEAQDQDTVGEATAFVCPGRQCMELEMPPRGPLRLRVVAPDERDRYVPSADRLLTSVARAVGRRAIGVVLTGMGDDGVQGARAILDAGGIVVAESELTAVVYGMPGSAVRAGATTMSLPLNDIGDWMAKL
ncbi:MAG TPA: chemotaxis-specific protein-glutamate methyltransferase CheB [Polyangiaceae bacterium]|jgi:two-component system chemotaxis response regulator CheB